MSTYAATADETVVQLATRLGMTWAQWTALPVSERDRLALADSGIAAKPSTILDLPVADRLAAFHASLTA